MPDEAPIRSDRPKRERIHQDWVTSFDRDLIRASMQKRSISFETLEDETVIQAELVLQVDREFVKLRIDGIDRWINKSHMTNVVISS